MNVLYLDMFLRRGFVTTSPKPLAGGTPLFGCPRLLIQLIRSYSPYWRLFLCLQPEDMPCHGDRDPLTMSGIQDFVANFIISPLVL